MGQHQSPPPTNTRSTWGTSLSNEKSRRAPDLQHGHQSLCGDGLEEYNQESQGWEGMDANKDHPHWWSPRPTSVKDLMTGLQKGVAKNSNRWVVTPWVETVPKLRGWHFLWSHLPTEPTGQWHYHYISDSNITVRWGGRTHMRFVSNL